MLTAMDEKINKLQLDLKVLVNSLEAQHLANVKQVSFSKGSEVVVLEEKNAPQGIKNLLSSNYNWKEVQTISKYYYFVKGRYCYEEIIGIINETYMNTSCSQQIKKYFGTLRNEFKGKIMDCSLKVDLEEVYDLEISEKCYKFWKDEFGELKLLKPKENEENIIREIFFGSQLTLEMKWVAYILLAKINVEASLFSTILKELDNLTSSIPESFLFKNVCLKKK